MTASAAEVRRRRSSAEPVRELWHRHPACAGLARASTGWKLVPQRFWDRLLFCAAIVAVLTLASRAWASPPDAAGQWLVDRARTYGLSVGKTPSSGHVELMLVWLRAAARLSPDLADAYLGQHDLLVILGREDDAIVALEKYCACDPGDHIKALDLIARGFSRRQTIEDRIKFCETGLGGSAPPPSVASELHRLLARCFMAQGDLAAARLRAQASMEAYPFNFASRQMTLELFGDEATPEMQVSYLLASVSARPAQWSTMRSLAQLLDSLSLHEQAATWYFRAFEALGRDNTDATLPTAAYTDAARNARDGGQYELGMQLCRAALDTDPDSYDARTLLIDLARRGGQDELAAEETAKLRDRLAGIEQDVRVSRDALRANQIAWFHIETDVDIDKALEFAELAVAAAPDEWAIQHTYGLALVNVERWPEAQATLGPLITRTPLDQWAAWGLAQALIGLGDREAAVQMLRDGEQVRRSGPGYERIVDSLKQLGLTPLPPPDQSAVLAALEGFNTEVLRFPTDPGKYLQLSAEPVDARPDVGEPWRCRFRLVNSGPFPITIGPELMVEGQLLVSAEIDVPGIAPAAGYLPISIAHRPLLNPGEHLEVVQTLGVGPLAKAGTLMPQRDLVATFTVMLDPREEAAGAWSSKHGSALTTTTRLTRRKLDYSPAGAKALSGELHSRTPESRARAYECVAALLAERLLSMRGALDYQPVRVDKQSLTAVLMAGLNDADPLVRARTVDSLPLLAWKNEHAAAVGPLLADPDWLVRMMAVDLLATQQGGVFSPVAGRLAEQDPDPLVRDLARLQLNRLQAPPPARR